MDVPITVTDIEHAALHTFFLDYQHRQLEHESHTGLDVVPRRREMDVRHRCLVVGSRLLPSLHKVQLLLPENHRTHASLHPFTDSVHKRMVRVLGLTHNDRPHIPLLQRLVQMFGERPCSSFRVLERLTKISHPFMTNHNSSRWERW